MLARVRPLPFLHCCTELSFPHVKPHISACPADAKVPASITARMPLPRHVGQLLCRISASRNPFQFLSEIDSLYLVLRLQRASAITGVLMLHWMLP